MQVRKVAFPITEIIRSAYLNVKPQKTPLIKTYLDKLFEQEKTRVVVKFTQAQRVVN